ncbi:MAG: hypothetical protein Q7V88_06225 [Actinomycetota bacterium]|nr:hypothetical protein [Actinomycetota bacterium]
MIRLNTYWRRFARNVAALGAVVSTVMLVAGVAMLAGPAGTAAAAPINGGAIQILVPPGSPTAGQPLNSGGSATVFAMTPPVGASCTGDTTSGGYKIQSYMVPASVDPATLTFDSSGPMPAGTGASYRQPMFSSGGTPVVNRNTAVASEAGGPGLLTGLPTMSFALFGASGPSIVPAGTYNLGFACTLGAASATQLDKYWNVQLTFAADAGDVPSGITWTVVGGGGGGATTTTTAATTTTTQAGGSTTSTSAATTTTTAGGGTTTTVRATTTTLVGSGSGTTTTVRVGSGAGGNGGGSLSATGSSPLPLLVWGVLLLVFGRMVILLGRPLRVLPPEQR